MRASSTTPRWLPYLLLLPATVLLLGFFGAPFVSLFYYATQRVDLSGASSFVGLDNLRDLFVESRFHGNVVVTLVYLLGVLLLSLPVAYVGALLVTRQMRGVGAIRTLLLTPWVLAPVVTALLFRTLVDPTSGPIAGLTSGSLVSSSEGALFVMIFHGAWRSFPIEMLLLAASMSGIQRELYEAVRVDGGSRWQEFRGITLPLTRPALMSAVMLISVFTLHDAESVYALTQGGPGYSTEASAVRLFKEAFLYYNVGLGAAIGVGLVVLTAIILFVLSRVSRRLEADVG